MSIESPVRIEPEEAACRRGDPDGLDHPSCPERGGASSSAASDRWASRPIDRSSRSSLPTAAPATSTRSVAAAFAKVQVVDNPTADPPVGLECRHLGRIGRGHRARRRPHRPRAGLRRALRRGPPTLGSRHRRWADALRGPRPEPARHRGRHDLPPRRRPGGLPARGWGARASSTPSTWVLFAQRPSRASAATTSGQGATKTPSSPGGRNSSAGSTSTRRSSPSISAARGWVLLRDSSTATAPTAPGRFASIPARSPTRQLAVPALFVGLAQPLAPPGAGGLPHRRARARRPRAHRDPAAAPTLVAALPTMHAAWGVGFLAGHARKERPPGRPATGSGPTRMTASEPGIGDAGSDEDLMRVVILAGGLGTRLQEETETRPKPMVEIGGRPILWHIMKLYGVVRSLPLRGRPRLQGRRSSSRTSSTTGTSRATSPSTSPPARAPCSAPRGRLDSRSHRHRRATNTGGRVRALAEPTRRELLPRLRRLPEQRRSGRGGRVPPSSTVAWSP